MRTVSDATASGVTSLRLLRSHLMCRTGSSRPFRIRVASLWHLIFHACSSAPRGSPRSEAPRAQRFSAHERPPYLRARRFPLLLLPRIPHFSSTQSPCPLRSSRRRSPPRFLPPTKLTKKLRRALPRRDSPQPFRSFRPERRSATPSSSSPFAALSR